MSDKLLKLKEWDERAFLSPHHKNTLLNWVRNGCITPKPIKIGKYWYVKASAKFQG